MQFTQHVFQNPVSDYHLSNGHDKTKNKPVRPAETQICMGIHPVWPVLYVCLKGS